MGGLFGKEAECGGCRRTAWKGVSDREDRIKGVAREIGGAVRCQVGVASDPREKRDCEAADGERV